MMERLEAEQSLARITEMGVAFGGVEEDDRNQFIQSLRHRAGSKLQRTTSAAGLAAIGIQVETVEGGEDTSQNS